MSIETAVIVCGSSRIFQSFTRQPRSIQQRIFKQTYPYALGAGYGGESSDYSAYEVAKDFLAYSVAGTIISHV